MLAALQPPANPQMHFGVAFLFSLLQNANGTLVQDSIANLLTASTTTQIPVFIGLDCENWWDGGPWNWFDPTASNYNPAYKANVEMTGWVGNTSTESLMISWRNWGSQIRVIPAPNLFSPALMALCKVRVLHGIQG